MTITDIPRPLHPDETGGFDVFTAMLHDLRHKQPATTGEYPIIEPDDERDSDIPAAGSPQPARVPVESRAKAFLHRTLTRAKAAILRAVETVREAKAWLFSEVPNFNPRLITRCKNRFFGYKGTHHVQRAWYGRQMSTSAAVAVTRERHARAQQTSRTKEGVLSSYFPLPEYWVSHMTSLIEVIREEHSFLRPSTGRHW